MQTSPDTDKPKTLGQRIREARKDADLSQTKLAREIGVSDRAVQNWEQGLRSPQVKMLQRISGATRKPMGFFFGEDAA